jgi:plastocyanin
MLVRRNTLVVGAALVTLALGGTAAAAPLATYKLAANKSQLKFNKTTIRAKAGKVTLSMANPSSLPHAIGIQGKGKGKTVGKGGTSTYTATLKKGTYTFYCPVGGHANAGMKGKLIVS